MSKKNDSIDKIGKDEIPKNEKIKSKSKSKPKPIKEKNISKKVTEIKESKIPLLFINYTNRNQISRDDLKNKTELKPYDDNDPEFNKYFIEFRQFFFENLLLTEDLKDDSDIKNIHSKVRAQSALFSTFIYKGEFIEPFINQFKMPSIIIRHEENQKYNAMDEYGNYIKFVFPKISQALRWGKFHSKLIILKFPKFLRIIVPSANLIDGDWYYWGQIILFQDFPLIDDKEEKDKLKSEDFRDYLKQVMKTFMPHTYEGKRFWTDLEIDFDQYDFILLMHV